MFNSILLDFMGGDEKYNLFYSSKRVVKAATLIKDRVNQNALKYLITKTFSIWQKEMYAGNVWEQIEQILHLSEPMVMPKEYGEMHMELQKKAIKLALDKFSGDYDVEKGKLNKRLIYFRVVN